MIHGLVQAFSNSIQFKQILHIQEQTHDDWATLAIQHVITNFNMYVFLPQEIFFNKKIGKFLDFFFLSSVNWTNFAFFGGGR
jgi:hypothetical protein